jgi:hypothetical protein
MRVEATPQRLERGRYLFENLCDCVGCHTPRDASRWNAYPDPARAGAGFAFPAELGFPGRIVAPNITPDQETGIGSWTDGEKLRAMREGVGRDGHALFAFMPYKMFARMSDEDAKSVVVYINSLAPIRQKMERTTLDFPVNILNKFTPRPLDQPVPEPDRSNPVAYGSYLVAMGGCRECHSMAERGEIKKGMEYAGGREFHFGKYLVLSANITPDKSSGIGDWSANRFIARFRVYSNRTYENAPPTTPGSFTLMPWYALSKLTDADLKAIYAFLRTVPPVDNGVDVHAGAIE